jgi:hypothetical protein
MNLYRTLLPFALVFAAVSAQAWNDTGHMVIAEIARRQLDPAVLQEANALLQVGGTERTREFICAACWADDTRTPENGPWHYINLHFRDDGRPSSNVPLEENAVVAIRRFSAVLRDRSRPQVQRADALRFLLHFVGDLHQPLHAVARDSDEFPKGDRGGNDFAIQAPAGFESNVRNLHILWDLGVGVFPRTQRPLSHAHRLLVEGLASSIMAAYPRESIAGIDDLEPMNWAREGLAVAKTVVYDLEPGSRPDTAYIAKAQPVAALRAAMAGYRLANVLNGLLRN